MNDIIAASVGGVVGLATVWKAIAEVRTWGHKRSKEDYEFAAKYFNQMSAEEDIPVYIVEKGLFIATGIRNLSASEVAILLQLQNPVESLQLFESGRKFLCIQRSPVPIKIAFRAKYCTRLRRRFFKISYIIGYSVFMALGFLPLLFTKQLLPIFASSNYTLFLIPPLFVVIALMCLNANINLGLAENLVNSYKINRNDRLSASLLSILESGAADEN